MRLHELKPPKGAHREPKRVGRGIAAGQGKTSGRGQKGQGSRSSVSIPRGFEGGQMPIFMRLPKLRGFHNRSKRQYAVVNLGKLNRYEAGSEVDEQSLLTSGLVSKILDGVKVLSAGGISRPLHLRVTAISEKARTLVEKAGGTVTLVQVVPAIEETADGDAVQAAAPEARARRPRAATPQAAPVPSEMEADAAVIAAAESGESESEATAGEETREAPAEETAEDDA